MAAYRIRNIDADGKPESGGHMKEAASAFEAVKNCFESQGLGSSFILLYTEKDKNPGWECFCRGENMFHKLPYYFVEKVRHS